MNRAASDRTAQPNLLFILADDMGIDDDGCYGLECLVRDLNFKYLSEGKGAPVTARFGLDGIMIIDPNRAREGNVFQRIYVEAI